jgi:tight adherence protein C
MTAILLLLGRLLTGVAAALGLRAAALPGLGANRRLGQIRAYGFGAREEAPEFEPRPAAGLARLADAIGRIASDRLGNDEEELRKELMSAGLFSLSPTSFLGYRALAALGLGGFFLWVTVSSGSTPLTGVVLTIAVTASGWFGPLVYIRRKARMRFEQIEYDLPELVDLLVVIIEAGLGLSSAMQLASSRITGPLGDELRLTLQEQRMGLGTTESLSNMLVRCETPSMRSFVRSVLQGETLGVSIGSIMRNLAHDMRIRRRQAAEQRAQKAPVKILFPLVFFIFPPMFIVLLFPAVYNFSHTFGGGV